MAIEALAIRYAGQPVVFLEYDVDHAPNSRFSRFWAKFSGSTVALPIIQVDSGDQISNGYLGNFYSAYQSMVEASRVRPPQVALSAAWQRLGNQVRFLVHITNNSGVTLSSASNGATVHAIVYEEKTVNLTGRFVRSAISAGMSSLANGASADYALQTGDLSGVDWAKLRFLVLVDYRPGGSSGAYDMLQAAYATPLSFDAQPAEVLFLIDPADPGPFTASVTFSGATGLGWSASDDAAWLSVSPSSGTLTNPATLQVGKAALSPGWQQATATFTLTSGGLQDSVLARVFYGSLSRHFLPLVRK